MRLTDANLCFTDNHDNQPTQLCNSNSLPELCRKIIKSAHGITCWPTFDWTYWYIRVSLYGRVTKSVTCILLQFSDACIHQCKSQMGLLPKTSQVKTRICKQQIYPSVTSINSHKSYRALKHLHSVFASYSTDLPYFLKNYLLNWWAFQTSITNNDEKCKEQNFVWIEHFICFKVRLTVMHQMATLTTLPVHATWQNLLIEPCKDWV